MRSRCAMPIGAGLTVSPALLALALIMACPAAAEEGIAGMDMGGSHQCTPFKWPLDKEQAEFEDPALPKVASGAAEGAIKGQAFALELKPASEVDFALPPERKSTIGDEARGGIVTFAAPAAPGIYQVTLSAPGWIDIVQNGAFRRSVDHTGGKNCPLLGKSVRFKFLASPVTLQVSDTAMPDIKIAISKVE